MSQMTLDEALQIAIRHHQSGRLGDAETLYRQILAVMPEHPEALHLLGVLAGQAGQSDSAIELIRRAISLRPDEPMYRGNLAKFLADRGAMEEAIAELRQAVALRPDYAEGHNNLGALLHRQQRVEEAIACYQRAIQIRPDQPEVLVNLGTALDALGRLEEAVACYRHAVRIKPDFAVAYNNLGNDLRALGRIAESIEALRQAVHLVPDLAEAHNNLGHALYASGLIEEAAAAYRAALGLKPDLAPAHNGLANTLKESGRVDQAILSYQVAIVLEPGHADFDSNLIVALQYASSSTRGSLLEAAREWEARHAAPPAGGIEPHANKRDPNRRLRIGYVSGDFRAHSIALFMLPLLHAHNRAEVEIFCYSNSGVRDEFTDRLRPLSDHWRVISNVSDSAAAATIRADGIDILVDLSLHTAGNRLPLFAGKPAPVQVTYLAYIGATGMRAIDYRFSDPHLDPPGTEQYYTEETWRLPETYWCYFAAVDVPAEDLLAASRGTPRTAPITLGCLNNFCKVSPVALETWARIMQRLPESQLILHAAGGSHRAAATAVLGKFGIAPDRCEFIGRIPQAEYFATYRRIDIALDPFPFAGGTTTCDALWMGVPVVTLAGSTGVGRGGVSILSNVGLPELIAATTDEYIKIAVSLAQNPGRLRDLRASLRQRMQQSPLTNASRFAKYIEAAYRGMWQKWCAKTSVEFTNTGPPFATR